MKKWRKYPRVIIFFLEVQKSCINNLLSMNFSGVIEIAKLTAEDFGVDPASLCRILDVCAPKGYYF